MKKFPVRSRTLFALLPIISVIPGAFGCAHAQSPAANPPAIVAPAAVRPAPMVIGGVKYDPAPALSATVAPKFDVNSPPDLALTYSVKFKGANDETIPAILTLPGKKAPKAGVPVAVAAGAAPATASAPYPCVLLGHGIGGKKEDVYLLASFLAGKGYASFVMDTAGHGERPRLGGKTVYQLSPTEFRTMCGETVADYRRAVDYLTTRPDIDASRLGYCGISLGGILGGVFVGDEPRIKTAVLWAAGGNWGKLMTTSSLRGQINQSGATTAAAKYTEKDANDLEAILADVDPLNVLPKAAGRPLYFINGDKDMVVPVPCAEELYARVKEPKKRLVLPGGHIPDALRMTAETITFFNEQLAK